MGSSALYRWVKNFPIRVIFCLCLFFATLGEAQQLPFTWARSAGTGSDQEALAVAADQNGNVYVTGYIKGNSNFSSIFANSAGGEDIFIAKYDLDGNILWAKPAGGIGDDRGYSIAVDNSGNVYICGSIENSATFFGTPNITVAGAGTDVFVAKYNSSGNVLWVKRENSSSDGISYGICTNGTDVFVTGQFAATINFGALPALSSSGNHDVFIASLNASTGAENWAIKGGSASDDVGSGIAADASGIYITGTYDATITFQNMTGTMTNNGSGDIFVVKYNTSGTGIWKRRAGGTADDHETSISVSGPFVYVAGHFHSTMSFYDTGPAVAILPNASGEDAFVAQWNATTGNYAWSRSENGIGADRALAVAANPAGDVFVTGNFNGTLPFGSGPSVTSNADDIFVTKYNSSGTFQWGKKVSGSNDDFGKGIVAPDNTSAYLVGGYKSMPASFDALTLNSTSNFDIFTAKLGCTVTIADAGPDQSLCVTSVGTLAANTPIVGTGAWTLVSGSGIVTTPTNPTSTVSGLGAGANVFQWTITNASCPASTLDQVTINVDAQPTTANAGPDQNICSSAGTFAGNAPLIGTGTWTLISGTGVPTTPSSPTSAFTGITSGTSVFQWSITNGVCPASTDLVNITRDPNPTTANAGGDQTVCSASAVFAGNNPAIGTGVWTLIAGTGTISNPNSPTSPVNGLSTGVNTFRWTISNGSCTPSFDQVNINVDPIPTVSNAGPDQTICSTSGTFAGNVPTTGIGTWTLISGTGTIAVPTSATSSVTGLSVGANVFRWTITSGVCPSSFDEVTITRNAAPTTASVGPDQTICTTSATLSGNMPAVGSGVWSLISGTGVIASPSSNNSTVNGLSVGTNVFQWSITNGVCTASSDQVTITVDPFPTVANAGLDQNVCSGAATLAGNTPTAGTGFWTLISGTGTITTATSPTSGVTGLSVGANVFRWTITSGTCPSSFDQVTITRDANPTIANAGTDQNVCTSTATLAANAPAIGTGTWTVISGTGIVTSPTSNNSGVTGLTTGSTVFQWTISNGTCPSSSDQVTIFHDANPTVANAGPDQTICSSSATLAGNVPSTGTGFWTLVSGTGIITTPSSASSTVTGLSGVSVFRWTISNGTCPSTFDNVTVTRDPNPTTSSAGPDQTICSASASLAGNAPSVGTGIWTLISGTGTIITPTSPTSGVTGLSVGANVFRWTISNGTCPSSTDQVTITVDPVPTISNAGPDQTLCSASATLAGNTPTTGSGFWTLISGTGTITLPSSPSSGVTGLSLGANVFRWTITSGTCPSSFDEVAIIRDANPTIATAGADQTLCSSSTSLAGNTPAIGNGIWTLISGTGTIATPTSPTSTVTGLSVGATIFRWTITNGTCPSSTDEVTINIDPNPTIANAGADQTNCSSSATLAGNIPTIGNGTWTLISGTGTIATPSSPSSGVTGLSIGPNVFQWTISNGTCPSSSDQVTLTRDPNPTTAAAGADQTICSSSTSLAGNTPIIGSGVWTLISGTGTIVTPTSSTSSVSGLTVGANVFRWTITNGTCPASFDEVTINVDQNPTIANAGADQTNCSSSATLAGNIPTIGNGTWTLISGTGTITTPSSPSSGVTGLSVGANVFQWTISNGTCPSSSDQVTLTRDPNPTTAAAGADQTICSSSTSLAGNTPIIGSGVWTLISGTGTIVTPTSSTSSVSGLTVGANVFRWTITNGTCPASFDEVTINVDQNPTIANAGADQTNCSSSATLAGNIPTIGNGTWTLISGTGTIATPSSPSSGVTGLSVGANVFRWTISNGTCPSSSDLVTINVDANPTISNAGADQTICSSVTTLSGNNPSVGTGTWTLISGTGTIVTPSSPTSGVNGLSVGATIFRWTISNGTCPVSFDEVTINVDQNPTIANAGLDQTICTSSATFAGNTPVTGNGSWTLISGTGTIANINSPSSAVTGLSVGANVFQWTISSGTCPSSTDQVTITVDPFPTTANAGPDQTICSSSATLAGNVPSVGAGTWTLISGTGTIVAPSAANSTVNGLSTGPNVFRWTVTNGTCPSSIDEVTINVDSNPSVASAGPDQTLCSSSATLAGNIPSVGTGTWTLISGTGTITTPALQNSGVTGLSVGANVFQWTITNGTCPSSFDQVVINRDANPTIATAGIDQTICSPSTTLAGNTPAAGTGIWTLVSGTGTIVAPTSPTSAVNGLSLGANIFQWTISNGTCPSSSDQVTINVDQNPSSAVAGIDQTLCTSSTSFLANTPSTGTGTWTLVSGTGTIVSPSSPNSTVNGLSVGANIFQWTISNGMCPSSSDQVTINRDAVPTIANAGADQTICSSSSVFAGNNPSVGTGVWTLISGTGTIANPSSATSSVTGLSVGANVFQWTISNGTCTASSDQVTITVDPNPTTSAAGPDQTICSPATSLAGNTPLIGNGGWTLISGTGTITSPSSPTTTVTGLTVGATIFQWTISNSTCPSSTDQVTITVDPFPTTSNAGPDQTICTAGTNFAGNIPAIGIGTWYLISGTGTIVTPNSPTSAVNVLSVGANVFKWEITNGTCPASSDLVTIFRDQAPSASSAGGDQTICATTALLSGNAPVTGSGNWTVIAGTGNISAPASSATSVTGLSTGANIFQWEISNGTCPSSTDQVTINVDANPSTSNAGTDQTICSSSSVFGATIPLTGNGTWNVVSSSGIISNPAQATSAVTNLATGINLFEWVVTNGVCPDSHDTVAIVIDQFPTVANAGQDQQICSSLSAMNGNVPVVGTGTWLVVSSTGNFGSASVPNTSVTNLATGLNTFEWVIANGTCPASRDTVSIVVDDMPSAANAGTDQLICSGTSGLQALNPSVGSGTWYVINGPALVSNTTSPSSGVTNLDEGSNQFQWVVSNGVCPVSIDTIQIFVDSMPTVSNAGVSQTICSSTSVLNGNTPLIGSGQWYVVNSPAALTTPLLSTTAVTGLGTGLNSFEWVTSNGVCPSSRDTVVITVDANPTAAYAGTDELICDPIDTLTGNIPLVGSGTWYSLSVPPVLANPTAATTQVSNLASGWNSFEWVITNGTCPAVRDTVAVFYTQRPSAPNAGADIFECAYDVNMQAEIPTTGTGYWTNLSNTGSFTDPADPNSMLNNLPDGTFLYTWTTTNAYCSSRADTVTVTIYSPPSIADAGDNQIIHTTFATLNAVPCDTGIGTWSFVTGSGQFENVNDPASRVTGLANGINILRWTASNGVCSQNSDTMQIDCRALIIPTGYSPNGDGTNDNFVIEGLTEYSNVKLEIFNRWGNQVYISSDYKNDWNGVGAGGEILPDDIYYYVMKLEDGTVFTGYVSLKQRTL